MRLRLFFCGAFLSAALLAPGRAVRAHHAWHGYDMNNMSTIRGTVTQFDWGNPHVWINFEAKDEQGVVQKWSAGGPSPSRMAGKGWDKSTLKPGDTITAVGHRISDGTFFLRLEKIVLPDGRELLCYADR